MSMIKRILNTRWIILLFLFLLFTPGYFLQKEIFALVRRLLRYAVILFLFIAYNLSIREKKSKRFNITLLILWILLLISTILYQDAPFYEYAKNILLILSVCIFVELLAILAPYNGLQCMYRYFVLCVFINTATVFIFPNAMYAQQSTGNWICWFLGDDNSGYTYYIVASTLAMIHDDCIAKKITGLSIMTYLCAFVFVFHNQIATGIVSQIVWLFLFLGYRFRWGRKFLKPRYVIYALAGIFVGLVFLRSFILKPIVSALNRDVTLSTRTILWDNILSVVLKRPFWGYGTIDIDTFRKLFSTSSVTAAHNYYLQILLWGGFPALILFGMLIYSAGKDGRSLANAGFYYCAVIGLATAGVRFMAETGFAELFYLLLTLVAFAKEFTLGLDRVPNRRIRFKCFPGIKIGYGNYPGKSA